MDKFGIFNLLNSFLGFANEKKESENGVSPRGDSGFSGSSGSPSFPNFSGTENSANARSSKNGDASPARKNGQAAESAADKPEFLPLQQGMLSVMRSHDEFVKRVREKNARTERSEKTADKPK